MATFTYDKAEVARHRWGIPPVPPGGSSPKDAMTKPGNYVKSKKPESSGVPQVHGRVVKYAEDEVIIVSPHYSGCNTFVWKGTSAEYFATWDCD